MLFIINDLTTNELLATFYADSHKITCASFIQLFLKNCKYQYNLIENSYTKKMGFTLSNFILFNTLEEINNIQNSNKTLIDTFPKHIRENVKSNPYQQLSIKVVTSSLYLTKKQRVCLNETQKNILEGTLNLYFDDITKLEPSLALQVLDSVFDKTIEENIKNKSIEINWRDTVEQIRKIINHPCPQNRAESIEGLDNIYPELAFFNYDRESLAFEKRGLLSLSARNDETTAPVTKEAVLDYIKQYIEKQKLIQDAREIIFTKTHKDSPYYYQGLFDLIQKDSQITKFHILLNNLTQEDYAGIFNVILHIHNHQLIDCSYIKIAKNNDLYKVFYYPPYAMKSSDKTAILEEIKDQVQNLQINNSNISYQIIFYTIGRLLSWVLNHALEREDNNKDSYKLACDCCQMVLNFWQQNKDKSMFKNQTVLHLFNIKKRKELYQLLNNNLIHYNQIPENLLSSLELLNDYNPKNAQDDYNIAEEISMENLIFSFPQLSTYLKNYLHARQALLDLAKHVNLDYHLLDKIKALATAIVHQQCVGDIFTLLPDEIYFKNPTLLWYLAHYLLENKDFVSAYEREIIINAQKRAASSDCFEKHFTDKTVARVCLQKKPDGFDAITIAQLGEIFGKDFVTLLKTHHSKEAELHNAVWQKGIEIALTYPEDNSLCEKLGEMIDSIKIGNLDLTKFDAKQLRILKETHTNKTYSIIDWLVLAGSQGHFQAERWVIYQLNQHNKACWEAIMKNDKVWCYFIPRHIDKTVWLQHIPEYSKIYSSTKFCTAVIKALDTCDTSIINNLCLTDNAFKNLCAWQKEKGIQYPHPFIFNEDLNQYPEFIREDLAEFFGTINTNIFSPLRNYIEKKEKEYQKKPDPMLKIKINQLKIGLKELLIISQEAYKKNEFLLGSKNTDSTLSIAEQKQRLYDFKDKLLYELSSKTVNYLHSPFIKKHRNRVKYFFSSLALAIGKLFTCYYLMWPSSPYITAALQTGTIPTETSLFLWKQADYIRKKSASLSPTYSAAQRRPS